MARLGLVAKGVVYLLFGGLACYAALGRGRVTDEQGAMTSLFRLPFGKFLLGALAVGLLAYSLWRFYELVFNPEDHDGFWSARAKPFLSAIVYGSLSVEALRMIVGYGSAGEGEGDARQQAALVMSLPLGHWFLVAFGAVLVVSSGNELWQNIAGKTEPEADLPNASMRRWYTRLARLGEIARGIIGLIAGAYLVLGGFHRSPGQVRASRGALEKIAEQPFGRWLLLLTALGLVFYGLVQWIEAWNHRSNSHGSRGSD